MMGNSFVNSPVNGILLLLTFGLLCALLIGALAGFAIAAFIVLPGLFIQVTAGAIFILLLYGPFVGICLALVPGILYGLTSYYFTKRWHWMFDGAFYGAVGYVGLLSVANGAFFWPGLVVCMSCGALVGAFNLLFPAWWGMRLRTEGIELLRQKR